ncbi:MAG: hypothetical protein WAO45_00010 [Tissierellaceae bacterium]
MAKDAIEAVKEAEQQGHRILQEATQASRDSKREAELTAQKKYMEILEEANREAEALREKALKEGEEISAPLIETGIKEAEEIIALPVAELDLAANIIIERIVSANGNS